MTGLKELMRNYGVTKYALALFIFGMFLVSINIAAGDYEEAIIWFMFYTIFLIQSATVELANKTIGLLRKENIELWGIARKAVVIAESQSEDLKSYRQATKSSKATKQQTKKS